jgi:CubicO group peptidase (beta-lactamase class C family)
MRYRGLFVLLAASASFKNAQAQDTSLAGLWYSKRHFGPEVRGTLELTRRGEHWRASIGARTADVRMNRDSVSFDLPSAAYFRGRLARDRASIVGQWMEPRRRIAMPVVLASCGTGCYRATIDPLEDEFTFYMSVAPRADGKLGAFLRNPERNQGLFIRLDHLARRGDTVYFRNARDSTFETGLLRQGMLSVLLRFATHDFRKLPADSFSHYYPRGWRTATYVYEPPRARNDGWSVARARDVGLSEERLAEMVRTFVNATTDSMRAFRPHGILIARHGKLVLEEYFLGEHANKPHDTRSASKTLVTLVLGAAMHAGIKVGTRTPVFASMGVTSPTLDSRKGAMTLRDLLTMSSGLDCDDAVEGSPGAENTVTNQDSLDWVDLVLGLKMVRDPGAQAVYCSIQPFLAGEVLARVTGRSFPDLAWELIGVPLQLGRYTIVLTPNGASYMGGGARFVARDFLKFAQLYANGGTWNGRRILTEAWVRESVQPRYRIGRPFRQSSSGPPVETTDNNYGYLWWTTEFEHEGRRFLAHHLSGNGGQYSLYMPDLGLVIATFGGNYADPGGFFTLRQLIPRHILPAVVR